jgi:3-deoxy-D-manno-octulosonic-acid transferase
MKRRYDLLYAIGALVSSPVLAVSLLRTGKWRTDWKGRLGRTTPLPADPRPTLLLHGVSVGEVNATRELVALLEAPGAPPMRLVVSATTNTGFERGRSLYGDRHAVVRFPFDFSWMMGRFLDAVRPDAVALMELEVWPNLAQECRRRSIPLMVINGRLSDASFGQYRWARHWIKPMFQGLVVVAAQTEEYARRFRELGTPPERIRVTDTMKWDTAKLADEVEGARELGAAMGIDPGRPLVVAGSTGPGEEEALIREKPGGVQLMLVPRKPERFDEVARLVPGIVRRSEARGGEGASSGDLFLLDTMGELTKAYSLADVAIVGRSFVPLGGSDPIEPVALGKPTVMGPRHENFREVVSALEAGGGILITDRPMEAVRELLARPAEAQAMAEAGREVIRRRKGATERHVRLIHEVLGGVGKEDGRMVTREGVVANGGAMAKENGVANGGGMVAAEGASSGTNGGAGGGQTAGHREKPTGRGTEAPRRRHRGVRGLLALLALYMAAGYLSTAFRRVEAEGPVIPTTPLPTLRGTLLSGVFSVHTDRSHDARGTRKQVAAAAAAAGLDFVVVGDHPPDDRKPGWELWDPEILEGVLVEGGQELRVPEAGKILVMGVDTTYRRWEGSYSSLVGMLRSRNATSFVVHPRGPRVGERWVQPTVIGMEGWEVLDISEAARRRLRSPWAPYHLLTVLAGFPLGLGDRALLHLMREGFDTPAVAAYDSLRSRGALVATAGLNVHPKLKLGPFLVPPYGPFFRTLVCHLVAREPLPPDPALASAVLREEIQNGNLFIALGGQDRAGSFRLGAVMGPGAVMGMGRDGPALRGILIRGGFEGGADRRVLYRILRNGREAAWIRGPELEWAPPRPGFYRVEVYTYGARFGDTFFRLRPWIFANPVGLMGAGDGAR